MHFITRLLKGDVAVSEELASDEEHFQEELRRFFQLYDTKQQVLSRLQSGESIHLHLHKLERALQVELEFVEKGEQTENEILHDLKYLSKEHYISRLEELLQQLKDAEKQDEYVKALLHELHEVLLCEARKVKRLIESGPDMDTSNAIVDLLTIEKHIVEKLAHTEDFRTLFHDLSYGTTRHQTVIHHHDRLEKKLELIMQNIDVGPDGKMRSTNNHYISELAARIFNRLDDAIMEAVHAHQISRHPNVDAEFVNSPLFERFVLDEVRLDQTVGKLVPSERTMNAFIQIFRRLYAQPLEVTH